MHISIRLLFIFCLGSQCVAQKLTDFDPILQKALTLTESKKIQTENAMRAAKKKLGTSGAGMFISGYMDMSDFFNKTIDSINKEDFTSVSEAQNKLSGIVSLNSSWIQQIGERLGTEFDPINENAVTDAWKTIFTSSRGSDKNVRKKLSKYLKRNIKWKKWTEIAGEFN